LKILETHIVPIIQEKIRLQEYAVDIFKSITSRSGIKKAIKREEILIDGQIAKTSDWIKEDQKIELLQQEIKPKKIFRIKLEVIFEDDYFAVVNKLPGYPTSGNYFKTIENALPFNLKISEQQDALPYPLPVHRLDNPTGGLLLIAKTRFAQTKLYQAFETQEIEKTYTALVHGTTPETANFQDKIDQKSASTKIQTLRSFSFKNENFSLVEVNPDTGRTHQIRIHLSLHGFPIVGDKEHGKSSEPFTKKGLYLAAIGLRLTHPITDEPLEFKTKIPRKFEISGS
jgi:tRNA pseudouridine65 synthase/23S rRNA pseudouridine1911/1915/1917 synthase